MCGGADEPAGSCGTGRVPGSTGGTRLHQRSPRQPRIFLPMNKIRLNDYSLVGEDTALAIENGLAEATWYASPVPKQKMRELLERRDGPAIRDTLLWFALIIGSGVCGFMLWGTWWAILPFAVYGVLYASTSDSRWHESGHGTAFKTDWMNNALYEIASFMVLRESDPLALEPRPPPQRHDHCRPRPGDRRDPAAEFVRPVLDDSSASIRRSHSSAISSSIAPDGLARKKRPSFRNRSTARWSSGPASTSSSTRASSALSIYTGSILPLMYVGLPAFYGSWLDSSSTAIPSMRVLPRTCSTIGSTAGRST